MVKNWVLVTGSSRGLGRELALIFATKNYNIILHGRNKDLLKDVKRKIKNIGTEAYIVIGDIRKKEVLNRLASIARKKRVSVLINNAGLACPFLSLKKLTDKNIREEIETGLIAAINITKRIYPIFLKKDGGTIININSIAGIESRKMMAVYSASKWGLRGFTDSLRQESQKHNIKIIGIYPTRIKTQPTDTYGMEPRIAAEKIYDAFKKNLSNLLLDMRPKKYKSKKVIWPYKT